MGDGVERALNLSGPAGTGVSLCQVLSGDALLDRRGLRQGTGELTCWLLIDDWVLIVVVAGGECRRECASC